MSTVLIPKYSKNTLLYFPHTDEWYMIVGVRTDKGFITYDCIASGKTHTHLCSVLEKEIGVNAFLNKNDFKESLKKRRYTYEYKSPVELSKEATQQGYEAILREIDKRNKIT